MEPKNTLTKITQESPKIPHTVIYQPWPFSPPTDVKVLACSFLVKLESERTMSTAGAHMVGGPVHRQKPCFPQRENTKHVASKVLRQSKWIKQKCCRCINALMDIANSRIQIMIQLIILRIWLNFNHFAKLESSLIKETKKSTKLPLMPYSFKKQDYFSEKTFLLIFFRVRGWGAIRVSYFLLYMKFSSSSWLFNEITKIVRIRQIS